MARVEKFDRALSARLDELEQRIFVLKINYDKYFSGLERREPLRERDEVKRIVLDFSQELPRNPTQRFKFQGLKARFQSLELFWTRNLIQMERGTHPKMKFKANVHERERAAVQPEAAPAMSPEQERVLAERQEHQEREERAYKVVYERYLEARGRCGQSTDLSFDTMRDVLKKQVRQIRAQFDCEGVKFRVVIEDGKAKVKAVPQTA
jgi:hypothetical protein